MVNDWFVPPQIDRLDLFTQTLSVFKKFLHGDEVEMFLQECHMAMQYPMFATDFVYQKPR